MWILNNFLKDFLFIICPGLITLILINIIPNDSVIFSALIVALLTIDSSHIYSTFWRTVFDSEERIRSKNMYIVAPILIGILLFLWFFLDIPFFWNFIIYLTVYHQIKQAIGLQKWYSKINDYFEKSSTYVMYLVTLFSFLCFHFRSDSILINFYSDNDLFIYPNQILFFISLFFLGLTFIYWIIFELQNLYKKQFYINKFLLMLIFMSVQIWCFLFGNNMIEVILPQLIYHAVSYQASIIQAVSNLKKKRNSNKLIFKTIFIIIFSLIIGFAANRIEEIISPSPEGNLTASILLAVYMIPTLCHHLWDAFIWKRTHPDWYDIFNIKNKEKNDELDY